MPTTDPFKTLRSFEPTKGTSASYYSLPALEEQGLGKISRLPYSIRVVLESVLRNCDGRKVRRGPPWREARHHRAACSR